MNSGRNHDVGWALIFSVTFSSCVVSCVLMSVRLSTLVRPYDPQAHNLSLMMGPPRSKPRSLLLAVRLPMPVLLPIWVAISGDRLFPCRDSFSKKNRASPCGVLLPLFITKLSCTPGDV